MNSQNQKKNSKGGRYAAGGRRAQAPVDPSDARDIYSYSDGYSARKTKKKWSGKKKLLVAVISFFSVILVFLAAVFLYVKFGVFGQLERIELDVGDLGITHNDVAEGDNGSVSIDPHVINIALFGIDTRDTSSDVGRSDAVMILSIDQIHGKIKLISIARDTTVEIDDYGQDKLTHAYAYGGPQLAVKTLNQNFNLDIQDFVTVNFAQLASIIDYVGGVTVNVDEDERQVMNSYISELNSMGIDAEPLWETGDVKLTGGQAVAYSRDRYTGGDVQRGQRQREVLMALFGSVKGLNVTQYPGLISMVLSESSSSLKDGEIMDIGMWAVSSGAGFEQCGLPNADCNAYGDIINDVWYYMYDLDVATDIIHKFIYDDILPVS